MEYFVSIITRIAFVILLLGVGAGVKRARYLSEEGEKDLSLIMMNVVSPALIFSSITGTLRARDLLDNIWLPLLSVAIHGTGYILGVLFCRFRGYSGDRRKIFIFHATMNNYFFMALPFALLFLPEKGVALLSVANIGSTIALWTLGISAVSDRVDARQTLRNFCSPSMGASVLSIVVVLAGWGPWIPTLASDVLRAVGSPILFLGLLLAGAQIHKLGAGALKFDGWNLGVGFVRMLAVPGLMFLLALLIKPYLSREALTIFMIVAITPGSVNSVTMALRYGSSAGLAAEAVLFTHLAAAPTMVGAILLLNRFLLA